MQKGVKMNLLEHIQYFVETEGLSFAETGRKLGLTRHKVKDLYRRKIKPYQPGEKQIGLKSSASYSSLPMVTQAREKLTNRVELLELRKLTNKRAMMEELRDTIKEVSPSLPPPKLLAGLASQKNNLVGILLLSDVHLGQQTPSRLSSGYAYDIDTTQQQFDLLFQQVLHEAKLKRWEKLIILDLGDTVDGDDMRSSQHRFVGPLVVEQVAMYGRLLASFVTSLLLYIPSIHIERVPGNHARTTQRPGIAGLAEIDPADSYDWLAGEFAREILRTSIERGRVKIINHDTFYSTLDLFGFRVLFEHGSSLRGGGGGLGIPALALQKALQGYKELEGEIHLYCLGHFHQPYSLHFQYNTLVVGNGSFPPTSPFVLSTKKAATRPSQTLLTLEKGKGITTVQHLWLDIKREQRAIM